MLSNINGVMNMITNVIDTH